MSHQASGQDEYLNTLISDKVSVSIFLINGIRLNGTMVSYDKFVLVLQAPTGHQVVYKHAVSTVQPDNGERPARPSNRAFGTRSSNNSGSW